MKAPIKKKVPCTELNANSLTLTAGSYFCLNKRRAEWAVVIQNLGSSTHLRLVYFVVVGARPCTINSRPNHGKGKVSIVLLLQSIADDPSVWKSARRVVGNVSPHWGGGMNFCCRSQFPMLVTKNLRCLSLPKKALVEKSHQRLFTSRYLLWHPSGSASKGL